MYQQVCMPNNNYEHLDQKVAEMTSDGRVARQAKRTHHTYAKTLKQRPLHQALQVKESGLRPHPGNKS